MSSLTEKIAYVKECADELIKGGNSKEQAQGWGMYDALTKLTLTEEEVRLIDDRRNGIMDLGWSTEDFKSRAIDRLSGSKVLWEDVYDESKFEEALHTMIRKADSEYGITWDTIDFYLDEYCSTVNYTVKCCNCEFRGEEEDLVPFKDKDGFGNGCPICETDEYLADIEPK